MKKKDVFLTCVLWGTFFYAWIFFSNITWKNARVQRNLNDPEKSINGSFQAQESGEVTHRNCQRTGPTPYKKITQIVLQYIDQIKNCPCNVDPVNETNLLCATNDTIDFVKERERMTFIPETMSPCVFVDKHGDSYKLADVQRKEDRMFRFLHNPSDSMLMCMPSVFLLGIPKCGTTSLHACLQHHQHIRETQRKEMGFWHGGGSWESPFFRDDNNMSRYNLFAYMSLSRYISKTITKNIMFELKPRNGKPQHDQTLILDSSPGNFNERPLLKLLNFTPNAKIILIMREPASRIFSSFRFAAEVTSKQNMVWFQEQTPEGFHKYVNYTLSTQGANAFSATTYDIHVRRILELMPKRHTIFLKYEEFIKDPVGVIEGNVLPVLGLEPFSKERKQKILNNKRTNPSKRVYEMLQETRTLLENHFREHNRQLSSILNDSKWTWGY